MNLNQMEMPKTKRTNKSILSKFNVGLTWFAGKIKSINLGLLMVSLIVTVVLALWFSQHGYNTISDIVNHSTPNPFSTRTLSTTFVLIFIFIIYRFEELFLLSSMQLILGMCTALLSVILALYINVSNSVFLDSVIILLLIYFSVLPFLKEKIRKKHVRKHQKVLGKTFSGLRKDWYGRNKMIDNLVEKIKSSDKFVINRPIAVVSSEHGEGKSFLLKKVASKILETSNGTAEVAVIYEEPGLFDSLQAWSLNLTKQIDMLNGGGLNMFGLGTPRLAANSIGSNTGLLALINGGTADWDDFIAGICSVADGRNPISTIVIIDDLDQDRLLGDMNKQRELIVFLEKYVSRIPGVFIICGVTLNNANLNEVVSRTMEKIIIPSVDSSHVIDHVSNQLNRKVSHNNWEETIKALRQEKKDWEEKKRSRQMLNHLPYNPRNLDNITNTIIYLLNDNNRLRTWIDKIEEINNQIIKLKDNMKSDNPTIYQHFEKGYWQGLNAFEMIISSAVTKEMATDLALKLRSEARLKDWFAGAENMLRRIFKGQSEESNDDTKEGFRKLLESQGLVFAENENTPVGLVEVLRLHGYVLYDFYELFAPEANRSSYTDAVNEELGSISDSLRTICAQIHVAGLNEN